jgi:hypothetical protein
MKWLEKLLMPRTWSRPWRRAFLLTIPISWPIWFVVSAVCVVVMTAVYILLVLIVSAKETLWD